MALTQGIGSPQELDGGVTGLERAKQFVTIKTAGARDLVRRLNELVQAASSEQILKKAVSEASRPIRNAYASAAQAREATGNLYKSVDTKTKTYAGDNGPAAVAVVGPRQTGAVGSRPGVESGNHAWLIEFGTKARKPGTRGRRTYVNVHQLVNKRFRRSGSFNNEQFANMPRGYYFLMGSLNKRVNAGGRPGYSRDFAGPGPGGDGRPQHPIVLAPGETIAGMKPQKLMENAINQHGGEALSILRARLQAEIAIRGG
jgi:hypothetical protein